MKTISPQRILKLVFLGLIGTLVCFTSMAAAPPRDLTWEVQLEGAQSSCLMTEMTFNVKGRKGTSSLAAEYFKDPSQFSLVVRKVLGLSLFKPMFDFLPISKISSINFMKEVSNGIRYYDCTTTDGDTFNVNDNNGTFFLCKEGDQNWHDRCLDIWWIQGVCRSELSSSTISLPFDFNKNGGPPPSNSFRLRSVKMLDVAAIQDRLAEIKHNQYLNEFKRASEKNSLTQFAEKYSTSNYDPDSLVIQARSKLDYLNGIDNEYTLAIQKLASLDEYIRRLTPNPPAKYCSDYDPKSREYSECLEIAPNYIYFLAKNRAEIYRKRDFCLGVVKSARANVGNSCLMFGTPGHFSCETEFKAVPNAKHICDILMRGRS
jgi:hypothetical protein